ncbi:C-type mannose receptor 2-like [Pomacea canaliculata]|uniref:C-type mannose receptor 2-like n=1 Tax=Pomacea canaliculata TaxID=400727 RepID=UPI000D73EF55|nr:C-type mannose receptor 2-like [Pomacea canaliculata]
MASAYILLLSAVLIAVNGDCPASTPQAPVRTFGNSCFQFHMRESREFSVAEADCVREGGTELIIRDEATQTFIYNTIRTELGYHGIVWIGLTDAEREGDYRWVDGSKAEYTNWASGQPGILGGLEDCVAMDMREGGKWHDYRCETLLFLSGSHPYICEFDKTQNFRKDRQKTSNMDAIRLAIFCSVVVYSYAQIYECPAGSTEHQPVRTLGSFCYQFHLLESREFSAAETACRVDGGNIVNIKTQEIQDFIYNALRHEFNLHGAVWIGLNDMSKEGHYVWVDGSVASYTNWAPGHPLILISSFEDCVIMDMDSGKWKNSNCGNFLFFSGSYPFVCEYHLVAK